MTKARKNETRKSTMKQSKKSGRENNEKNKVFISKPKYPTIPERRIRVLFNDPDFTESDNDDERENVGRKSKRAIFEFTTPGPESARSNKPNKSFHKGVRLRKWRRWAAEIRDPIKGARIRLGTFDNAESAVKAYEAAENRIREEKLAIGSKFEEVNYSHPSPSSVLDMSEPNPLSGLQDNTDLDFGESKPDPDVPSKEMEEQSIVGLLDKMDLDFGETKPEPMESAFFEFDDLEDLDLSIWGFGEGEVPSLDSLVMEWKDEEIFL